ncbi:5169_t:CDS:2 [Funneliformis caledonium]|uniref:5169_t:CDS:1 n=1 Tax=Funneliformis caledonium TaxID=1117310 RepID=A0A9N9BAY6_9GLOM|nr:5169_t:CDS:2 [Funneliformis caledonium]
MTNDILSFNKKNTLDPVDLINTNDQGNLLFSNELINLVELFQKENTIAAQAVDL